MIKNNFAMIDLKATLYYSKVILLSSGWKEWLVNTGKTVFSHMMSIF